jgi:hypothetical protein
VKEGRGWYLQSEKYRIVFLKQGAAEEKRRELAGLQQERGDSDADWEMRLQEAVDSAEQWKAFAEKLGKEKGEMDAQLTRLQVQEEVGVTQGLELSILPQV